MTAYFDARSGELSDMLKADAGFQEYYDFDKRLVHDIGLDVQLVHTDPAYNFPEDLKVRVYQLFWKYSFVANEKQDETETCPQSQMMRRLVDGLHDIYHERALRDHPLYDGVGNGVIEFVGQFRDAVKALGGAS